MVFESNAGNVGIMDSDSTRNESLEKITRNAIEFLLQKKVLASFYSDMNMNLAKNCCCKGESPRAVLKRIWYAVSYLCWFKFYNQSISMYKKGLTVQCNVDEAFLEAWRSPNMDMTYLVGEYLISRYTVDIKGDNVDLKGRVIYEYGNPYHKNYSVGDGEIHPLINVSMFDGNVMDDGYISYLALVITALNYKSVEKIPECMIFEALKECSRQLTVLRGHTIEDMVAEAISIVDILCRSEMREKVFAECREEYCKNKRKCCNKTLKAVAITEGSSLEERGAQLLE